MKILYEDNHLLVVDKPVNIPVQADSSADEDMLTLLKQYLKEKYNKPGNVYLGLVHRLDRPVGGVMVFARTDKAASRLSDSLRKNQFEKSYLAIVEGKGQDNAHLVDKLLKDPATNTVTVNEKGKEAILDYQLIDYQNGLSLLEVNLKTGRSHQIRVQLSSRDLPIWGDQRYNGNAKAGQQIALYSHKLSFPHPISKEILTFESKPHTKPFDIFGGDYYEKNS